MRPIDFFLRIRSAAIVVLDTVTVPKMRKSGNIFYDRTTKRSRVQAIVGCDYMSVINKQLWREWNLPAPQPDDFIPGPRPWGLRLLGCPFVIHKDTAYLECLRLRVLDDEYLVDSNPATPAQKAYIESFIPPHTHSPTAKDIEWRDYKLSGLMSVTFAGETTEFDHDFDVFAQSDVDRLMAEDVAVLV